MTSTVARRLCAGLVTIALVLLSRPALAQQFRLERDFTLWQRFDGRLVPGVYWVSLPLRPVIDDVANTWSAAGNKCVGDPDGPTAGDGIVSSDDLLCAWWTARADLPTAGTFTLTHYDPGTCTPISRIGTVALGRVRFVGTPFDLDFQQGLEVRVTVPTGAAYNPPNHAVITGDHDDAWTGLPIVAATTCPVGAPNCCGRTAPRLLLLGVPYHVLYATSMEILCGLGGVDWVDANADGKPDTCWDDADGDGAFDPAEQPTGVFDGQTLTSVVTYPRNPELNTPSATNVTMSLGQLRFTGTRFDLVEGDAYMLLVSPAHVPTVWNPAHR